MPRRASTLLTLLFGCTVASAALAEGAALPDGGDEGADRTVFDQGFEDLGPVEDARVLIDTGASIAPDVMISPDVAGAPDAGASSSQDTGMAPLPSTSGGGCAVAAPTGGSWVWVAASVLMLRARRRAD